VFYIPYRSSTSLQRIWLNYYADFASNCKLTADKSIECQYKSADQRLLSVKVYPKRKFPTDVVAQVKVGIDPKHANKMDTDFNALLSDGKQALALASMIVATTKNWSHVFILKANQAISRILRGIIMVHW